MDSDTWITLYDKLVLAYGKSHDIDQSQLYFDALKTMPGPTMRLAVEHCINNHPHFPRVSVLREFCGIASKTVSAKPSDGECETCHGSGWVDAPNETHHGIEYRNYVRRCPQCYPTKTTGEAAGKPVLAATGRSDRRG